LANNVFDRRYDLFGTYLTRSMSACGVVVTDRRSEIFGQPASIYGGIRVTF
jgi:hypothetical protein